MVIYFTGMAKAALLTGCVTGRGGFIALGGY